MLQSLTYLCKALCYQGLAGELTLELSNSVLVAALGVALFIAVLKRKI